MKLVCISCILFFFGGKCFSQTYFDTYLDSYEQLSHTKDSSEIDFYDKELQKLITTNRNQFDDIQRIIQLLKSKNKTISPIYIEELIKSSANYFIFKMETKPEIRVSFFKYRKVKQTAGKNLAKSENKTRYDRKIRKLLYKEQKARKRNQLVNEVDAQNAIHIKEILKDTVYISHLGFMNRQFLEIMLEHGGWINYKNEIELIRFYVSERYLHRDFFSQIFERLAIAEGYSFSILEDKIVENQERTEAMCNGFQYPSLIGGRHILINGKHLFLPINPKMTNEQVNQLRRFCFLEKIEFPQVSFRDDVLFPTVEEWCELTQNK